MLSNHSSNTGVKVGLLCLLLCQHARCTRLCLGLQHRPLPHLLLKHRTQRCLLLQLACCRCCTLCFGSGSLRLQRLPPRSLLGSLRLPETNS